MLYALTSPQLHAHSRLHAAADRGATQGKRASALLQRLEQSLRVLTNDNQQQHATTLRERTPLAYVCTRVHSAACLLLPVLCVSDRLVDALEVLVVVSSAVASIRHLAACDALSACLILIEMRDALAVRLLIQLRLDAHLHTHTGGKGEEREERHALRQTTLHLLHIAPLLLFAIAAMLASMPSRRMHGHINPPR